MIQNSTLLFWIFCIIAVIPGGVGYKSSFRANPVDFRLWVTIRFALQTGRLTFHSNSMRWLSSQYWGVTNKFLQGQNEEEKIKLLAMLFTVLHFHNKSQSINLIPLQVLSRSTWHWDQAGRHMSRGHLLWLIFLTTEVHSYSGVDYHQNSTQERRVGSL